MDVLGSFLITHGTNHWEVAKKIGLSLKSNCRYSEAYHEL
jgi:hypothetical protein